MTVLKVTTDDRIIPLEISGSLDSICKEIGGYERVRPRGLPAEYCMLVDDMGLLKVKPINVVSSVLYETLKHGQPIAGDILLVRYEQYNGFEGLSPSDVELLKKMCEKLVSVYNVGEVSASVGQV